MNTVFRYIYMHFYSITQSFSWNLVCNYSVISDVDIFQVAPTIANEVEGIQGDDKHVLRPDVYECE